MLPRWRLPQQTKNTTNAVSESAVETTLLQSKVGSGDEVNGDNKIEHEQS